MELDHYNPHPAHVGNRQNIITQQLATELPRLLDRSIRSLERVLEVGTIPEKLQASRIILKTATALTKLRR